MPSVRASCCPLPLATPSGECVNHQSSVTLLCLNYKWGLFSMIKQICHASGGNMMECLPSGGWFSLGLRPRENHPPSGKHSIMLPPLVWHICIILNFRGSILELWWMKYRHSWLYLQSVHGSKSATYWSVSIENHRWESKWLDYLAVKTNRGYRFSAECGPFFRRK